MLKNVSIALETALGLDWRVEAAPADLASEVLLGAGFVIDPRCLFEAHPGRVLKTARRVIRDRLAEAREEPEQRSSRSPETGLGA